MSLVRSFVCGLVGDSTGCMLLITTNKIDDRQTRTHLRILSLDIVGILILILLMRNGMTR